MTDISNWILTLIEGSFGLLTMSIAILVAAVGLGYCIFAGFRGNRKLASIACVFFVLATCIASGLFFLRSLTEGPFIVLDN